MQAYLMAQGQGPIVLGTATKPTIPAAPTPLAQGASPADITTHAATIEAQNWALSDGYEWCHLNDMALENINLSSRTLDSAELLFS